jgi:hypothetical protein
MKQLLENKITKLCKQLYTIGVNDGKGKISYYPLPYGFYAGKIIEAVENKSFLKDVIIKGKDNKSTEMWRELKGEKWKQFTRFFYQVVDLEEDETDDPIDRAKKCWKYIIKPLLYKAKREQGKADNKRFLGLMGCDEECRFSSLADEPCGRCEICGANKLRQELKDELTKQK